MTLTLEHISPVMSAMMKSWVKLLQPFRHSVTESFLKQERLTVCCTGSLTGSNWPRVCCPTLNCVRAVSLHAVPSQMSHFSESSFDQSLIRVTEGLRRTPSSPPVSAVRIVVDARFTWRLFEYSQQEAAGCESTIRPFTVEFTRLREHFQTLLMLAPWTSAVSMWAECSGATGLQPREEHLDLEMIQIRRY